MDLKISLRGIDVQLTSFLSLVPSPGHISCIHSTSATRYLHNNGQGNNNNNNK